MDMPDPAGRVDAEFRIVGPTDAEALAEVFAELDTTFFRPHELTRLQARRIAARSGRDLYALLLVDGRPVAYGMLRGWDEGYDTPSLGIAVRVSEQHKGYGRTLMHRLHEAARRRGAGLVRLRVHPDNARARRLYELLGYRYRGVERGELLMTRTL